MVMNMFKIMMFIFVEVYVGFEVVVKLWDCLQKQVIVYCCRMKIVFCVNLLGCNIVLVFLVKKQELFFEYINVGLIIVILVIKLFIVFWSDVF